MISYAQCTHKKSIPGDSKLHPYVDKVKKNKIKKIIIINK